MRLFKREERYEERSAFLNVFTEMRTNLFRYLLGKGLERSDAEDILQEVALVGVKKDWSGMDRSVMERLLYKIAKDKRADFFRKYKDHESTDDLMACDEPSMDTDPNVLYLVKAMLRDGKLNEAEEEALVLHYLVGYTVAEVASLVDAPFETVRTRLRVAKLKLRDFRSRRMVTS